MLGITLKRALSKKSKDNNDIHLSHLKNLILLAAADGHEDEIESHLLMAIAHRLNLSEEDIRKVRSNPESIEFSMPHKFEEKIEQFQDILTLISIDGHIDSKEEAQCRELGKKYELPEHVINSMLEEYL